METQFAMIEALLKLALEQVTREHRQKLLRDEGYLLQTSFRQKIAQEALTELRQKLMAHFSEQDLRTLCFDLGIEYDDLSGDNRESKARELINRFKRRESMGELLSACSKSRPGAMWDKLAEATQEPTQASKDEIERDLRQYLLEKEPFEACHLLFSSDVIRQAFGPDEDWTQTCSGMPEMAQDRFKHLGALLSPVIPWRYEVTAVSSFVNGTNLDYLSGNASHIAKVKRDMQSVYNAFCGLLKLVLIFYRKLFAEMLDNRSELAAAFAETIAADDLLPMLDGVARVEYLCNSDKQICQMCWQKAYRRTPFSGFDAAAMRGTAGDYALRVQHWDPKQVSVPSDDKQIVKEAFDKIRLAITDEFQENRLSPLLMVILYRGQDAYDRAVYGFADESDLFAYQVKASRWFYASLSSSHELLSPYFFVAPPAERQNGFFEPVLIPRQEVLAECIR